MEKYSILLGYLDKQLKLILRLHEEVQGEDLHVYANRYVFAMKVQQLYTAIEDLLKQIAKAFENHIQDLSSYHKELLIRLNTEIPKIRPAVIGTKTLLFLDKLRAFRHFARHAYDCELDEKELSLIQKRLQGEFTLFTTDIQIFRKYVVPLSS